MQVFQRRLVDAAQTQASIDDMILKGKTRPGQTPTMVQNYVYTGSFAAVAAGANAQINIPIQGDSDFIITYFSGIVFDDGTGLPVASPNAQIQVTDNSSQRAMFSNPVNFSLVMGNGGFPYLLQSPRLVTANTQLVLQFYNNSAATVMDAQVALSGDRVYYP